MVASCIENGSLMNVDLIFFFFKVWYIYTYYIVLNMIAILIQFEYVLAGACLVNFYTRIGTKFMSEQHLVDMVKPELPMEIRFDEMGLLHPMT